MLNWVISTLRRETCLWKRTWRRHLDV